MPVKAGKFVTGPGTMSDGNSGFAVNDVGFEPDLVIIMTAGHMAENTWSVGDVNVWGGIAVMTRDVPPYVNTRQSRTAVSEWWATSNRPASFYSNEGVIWFRGSPGNAIYLAYTHEDGFYIGHSGGFEGGYGQIGYYLAFQGMTNVKREFAYAGSPVYNLGFQPEIVMSMGHGGFGAEAGSVAMGDTSVPSWAFGGFENIANPTEKPMQWLANGLTHFTSVEQIRNISDGWGDQLVFDPFTAAQIIANATFSFSRTATTLDINRHSGFPDADSIRAGVHVADDMVFSGGSVTPNAVGTPKEVDTGFLPDAVIFISPQDSFDHNFGSVPWGGRSFGFLTEDFQCCIAWGAYSHLGPNASFSTSDFSWMSNFTTTQLSDPTNPNYGTAEIGGAGFIMHTQALPKTNKYTRYAAYAVDEEAPGFFRVIN